MDFILVGIVFGICLLLVGMLFGSCAWALFWLFLEHLRGEAIAEYKQINKQPLSDTVDAMAFAVSALDRVEIDHAAPNSEQCVMVTRSQERAEAQIEEIVIRGISGGAIETRYPPGHQHAGMLVGAIYPSMNPFRADTED